MRKWKETFPVLHGHVFAKKNDDLTESDIATFPIVLKAGLILIRHNFRTISYVIKNSFFSRCFQVLVNVMLQNLNSGNTHVELLKAVEEKLLVFMVNMKWCTMTHIVLKHWDEG